MRRRGASLIELIVALGLFSVIVSIAVGGFSRALKTQRQAASLLLVNGAASLTFEQMAREIRTGYEFCISGQTCSPNNDPSVKEELQFLNQQNERVTYCLIDGEIHRREGAGVCGGVGSEPITSDDINIRYLTFYVSGYEEGDGFPTRITVVMGVSPRETGVSDNIMRLETTVSPRFTGT